MLRITDYLAADVYYYELDLEVDASFTRTYDGEVVEYQEGAFPMNHSVLGLGIRYVF